MALREQTGPNFVRHNGSQFTQNNTYHNEHRQTFNTKLNVVMEQNQSHLREVMGRYKYKVVVGFNVQNATPYQMYGPTVRIKGGVVETPFFSIESNGSGTFVARKSNLAARGSCGTVSWGIQPKFGGTRRVVVMWSAPFDFNLHDNYLGVGISNASSDRDWFDTMYYSNGSYKRTSFDENSLQCHRSNYRNNCDPVQVSDDQFYVEGNMGTGHQPQIYVIVREG